MKNTAFGAGDLTTVSLSSSNGELLVRVGNVLVQINAALATAGHSGGRGGGGEKRQLRKRFFSEGRCAVGRSCCIARRHCTFRANWTVLFFSSWALCRQTWRPVRKEPRKGPSVCLPGGRGGGLGQCLPPGPPPFLPTCVQRMAVHSEMFS